MDMVSDVREYRDVNRDNACYGVAAAVLELRGKLSAFDIYSTGISGKRLRRGEEYTP